MSATDLIKSSENQINQRLRSLNILQMNSDILRRCTEYLTHPFGGFQIVSVSVAAIVCTNCRLKVVIEKSKKKLYLCSVIERGMPL